MSESVPNSTSSFAHRRQRADSTVSFTYFDEDERADEDWVEHETALDEEDLDLDLEGGNGVTEPSEELEWGDRPSLRRKSSERSRRSVDVPLLVRRESVSTEGDVRGQSGRISQKIYIVTEDLTIVVAGFKNSIIGPTTYGVLCVMTFGLAYLLLRWLPRWRVRLVGSAAPLCECDWVVIEVRSQCSSMIGCIAHNRQNQWGEVAVHTVRNQTYEHSLTTVFGLNEKRGHRQYDEDDDPILKKLRSIDYRYIRFIYHPLKDKFVLGNTWKDPAWTDVKAIRRGLDAEQKETRERVFGRNMIDIEDKSTGQLLVDEVCIF